MRQTKLLPLPRSRKRGSGAKSAGYGRFGECIEKNIKDQEKQKIEFENNLKEFTTKLEELEDLEKVAENNELTDEQKIQRRELLERKDTIGEQLKDLIVLLKKNRETIEDECNYKSSLPIALPDHSRVELNLEVFADGITPAPVKYELASFTMHIGGAGGGHYISYNCNKGHWYRCDDGNAVKIDMSNHRLFTNLYLDEQRAYALKFKRVTE